MAGKNALLSTCFRTPEFKDFASQLASRGWQLFAFNGTRSFLANWGIKSTDPYDDLAHVPFFDLVFVEPPSLDDEINRPGSTLESVLATVDAVGLAATFTAIKNRRIVFCDSSRFHQVLSFLDGKLVFMKKPVDSPLGAERFLLDLASDATWGVYETLSTLSIYLQDRSTNLTAATASAQAVFSAFAAGGSTDSGSEKGVAGRTADSGNEESLTEEDRRVTEAWLRR